MDRSPMIVLCDSVRERGFQTAICEKPPNQRRIRGVGSTAVEMSALINACNHRIRVQL
jgi:hypothetical protein